MKCSSNLAATIKSVCHFLHLSHITAFSYSSQQTPCAHFRHFCYRTYSPTPWSSVNKPAQYKHSASPSSSLPPPAIHLLLLTPRKHVSRLVTKLVVSLHFFQSLVQVWWASFSTGKGSSFAPFLSLLTVSRKRDL